MGEDRSSRPTAPQFVYDDGGRKDAGFKGSVRDCVPRAISIATGLPYKEVYNELRRRSKARRETYRGKRKKFTSPRSGVHREIYQPYLEELGWVWTPTMAVGKGFQAHLNEQELPQGPLIVSVRNHLTCFKDGEVRDTWDCSFGGLKGVYGYFSRPD